MLEQPGSHEDSCNSIEANAMSSSDHLVEYNDKVDMIYKAVKHTFDDGEDDMIKNTSTSNRKEATNNIENYLNIADDDRETIDKYEKTNSVSESTFFKSIVFKYI